MPPDPAPLLSPCLSLPPPPEASVGAHTPPQGSRKSIRGDIHFYGKQMVSFWTQTKTITSNWTEGAHPIAEAAVNMPQVGRKH